MTLQDVYHCAIDKDLFARKIEQAQTFAADLGPTWMKRCWRTPVQQRKWLSEAPHGWIKHVLGFRRFSLRGLAKVRGEWDLMCLALNVKRLHALMVA